MNIFSLCVSISNKVVLLHQVVRLHRTRTHAMTTKNLIDILIPTQLSIKKDKFQN